MGKLLKARVYSGLIGLMGMLAVVRTGYAESDPDGMSGGSPTVTREAEDDASRVSVAELRHTLPDLQLRDRPPVALLALQLGMHVPYQVLGVGLNVDLYPTRWLRLSGQYFFGFSPTENDATFTHYGEASIGVAVYEATVDKRMDLTTRAIPNADPFTLNTFVPQYRALFIEGGALTGFFSPARCTANCDDELTPKTLVAADRQFVMPFAGVRYVSYFRASSEHARFQTRSYFQLYAHLFTKPVNAPEYPIYGYNGERLDSNPIGGRVGIDIPPGWCIADLLFHTGCAQGGAAIGYNPTPGFVFLEFHLSYLVD